MKVSELIEELGLMDPDAEVHFSYNYGDHWHTTVAPKVEQVEVQQVVWSAYHRMPKVTDPEDGDRDERQTAVVLS
jgi:hypothetical protein